VLELMKFITPQYLDTGDVLRDVEKLLPTKFAKIKSRQEALQTTFSVFLAIYYPPNFGCFEENGVFQQPRELKPMKLQVSGFPPVRRARA
jgi:hypothetical protein